MQGEGLLDKGMALRDRKTTAHTDTASDDGSRRLAPRRARSRTSDDSPTSDANGGDDDLPEKEGGGFRSPLETYRLGKGAHGGGSGRAARRKQRQAKPHKPNFITRAVNQWANRLLGAVSEKSFAGQEAQYAAHRTSRDYIWNSVAIGAWGMVFPILSIVATQAVGAERAGMFSMAFVVANLLMIVANFGVRTYQVSDLDERHSFADYQINRVLTCALMMVVGVLYCLIRGYGDEMFLLCMGVFVYRMVDGLADVYEGRLQQVDKLYLAGISQALRSIAVLVVFSALLFVTRSLVAAAFGMAVVAVLSLAIVTVPLAYFESPKSRNPSLGSVIELFKHCFPLFIALFMYTLIDSMPKFVMEGVLSYDNQLYFNALYFPAQFIHLGSQLVYKPMLVRMAGVWADASKRRRFDLVIVAMMLVIVAIAAVITFIMAWVGIPVMSFLYGIDFEQFRGLAYIMLVGGAALAGIDFLYQTITILRRQRDVTTVYLITFLFALFIPLLLVEFTGLPGAVLSYLIIMSILFVLLVWVYARIRIELARHPERAMAGGADDRSPMRKRTRFVLDDADGRDDAAYGEEAAESESAEAVREVRGVREYAGRRPARSARSARSDEERSAAEGARLRLARRAAMIDLPEIEGAPVSEVENTPARSADEKSAAQAEPAPPQARYGMREPGGRTRRGR